MFWKDFGRGISFFWKALGFIFKNNLWYYFFFPLALIFLLWWGAFELAEVISDSAEAKVADWLGLEEIVEEEDVAWYTSVWNYILMFLGGATRWIVRLGIIFVGGIISKYIMLMLLSPVLAFLSEKTEKILTGNDYPFNMRQILKDVWRGVLLALRNMCIEFGWAILGWIILIFIPPVGIIVTPFLWLIGWYFYGFAMMDYVNERRRLTVGESVSFVRKHKGVAIGNGWMYALVLFIPFIGGVFAPIIACVGATLAVHDIVDLNNNPYAVSKKLEYKE